MVSNGFKIKLAIGQTFFDMLVPSKSPWIFRPHDAMSKMVCYIGPTQDRNKDEKLDADDLKDLEKVDLNLWAGELISLE